MASPRWFYQISGRWLPWLSLLTFVSIIIGVIWGLGFAPQDAKQGNSFRIIYIHVPASFLALVGYYIMAISGAIAIIWKIKLADVVMKSAAPIGASLTFIALLTGAVWGKTYLGYLLDMGRAYYVNVDIIFFYILV